MKHAVLFLSMMFATGASLAEMRAPERVLPPVTDPSMVIVDRGVKLEILPTKRAVPYQDATGRVVMRHVAAGTAVDPMGPLRLGVVFNHAMQQQGYISGEIVFKLKASRTAAGFSSSLYPGLKKITNPEVYVVNARTPMEFLKVMKRLQARSAVEWVEPTVVYDQPEAAPTTK